MMISLSLPATRCAPTYTADLTLSAGTSRTEQRALTPGEMDLVIARNSITALTHTLDDGSKRSQRARYAFAGDTMFLAAAECPPSLCCDPRDYGVECDVSEVDGLTLWHYIWIEGAARRSQPTGSSLERAAWREGIEQLRRVMPDLPRAEELAFANFGVVQVVIRARVGLALSMMERSSIPRV